MTAPDRNELPSPEEVSARLEELRALYQLAVSLRQTSVLGPVAQACSQPSDDEPAEPPRR